MTGRQVAGTLAAAVAAVAVAVVLVAVRAARAAWAVAVLLLSAADALVTAWLGVRPAGLWVSAWRRELADATRRGWHDAIDAEVVDEDGEAGPSGCALVSWKDER
ncbi:MAG UNVERIFIED_CONTAM: hypothetical protein LOD86_02335 [Thermobifida fusca]